MKFGSLLISGLIVSAALAPHTGWAASKYPDLKSDTRMLITPQGLVNPGCVNLGAMFKKCTLVKEVSATENLDNIAPQYRLSNATGILVEGTFLNTGGNFELVIDGVPYEIKDNGNRSLFPLPPSSNTAITVKVTSKQSGQLTLTRNFQAEITGVKLVLSNDSYLKTILNDLPELKSAAEDAKTNYAREKKLNGFLKRTPAEIRDLKKLLTGRDPDDFGDCEKTQDGIDDLLDSESCQIFRVCNDFLQSRPTEVDDTTETAAFAALDRDVTNFSDAMTVLTNNQSAIDQKYQKSLTDLLKYLESVRPKPETP